MLARALIHLRRNIVAYVALFVALGGTSYAATRLPAGSVTTRQVKNGSLLKRDVKRGQAPQGRKGATGPEGAVGPPGQAGSPGAKGDRGPTGSRGAGMLTGRVDLNAIATAPATVFAFPVGSTTPTAEPAAEFVSPTETLVARDLSASLMGSANGAETVDVTLRINGTDVTTLPCKATLVPCHSPENAAVTIPPGSLVSLKLTTNVNDGYLQFGWRLMTP